MTLSDIVFDANTQVRLRFNADSLQEYAAAFAANVAFTPIAAFDYGQRLILVDGFQRVAARIGSSRAIQRLPGAAACTRHEIIQLALIPRRDGAQTAHARPITPR